LIASVSDTLKEVHFLKRSLETETKLAHKATDTSLHGQLAKFALFEL
jgi:hypothetical protein